jgi:hypothetical protein
MKLRIAFLCLLLSLGTTAVYACSCGRTILEKEIDSTPVIFIGKAIEVEFFTKEINCYSQDFQQTTFKVTEYFKGSGDNLISLITDPYESTCGFSFEMDSVFLVFASTEFIGTIYDNKTLSTGYCSRTGFANQRTGTISKLRKIQCSIDDISKLSAEVLYLNIWKDERFIWTEKRESLDLTQEQLNQFIDKYLVRCKTDSIFPKNSFDSSMVKSNWWNYVPTMVSIAFDIDQYGVISNLSVLDDNRTRDCQTKAIEFVRKLGPWKPASIRGVNVKSRGIYTVDFAELNTR